MVRAQHVYNSVWTPLTDETHKLKDNKCGESVHYKRSTVAISERRIHISKDIDNNKFIFRNVWHHLNIYQIKQL